VRTTSVASAKVSVHRVVRRLGLGAAPVGSGTPQGLDPMLENRSERREDARGFTLSPLEN